MNRGDWHRHMSYVCAETGRHLEAEYHRLEYEAAELHDRIERYSIFHPWFWVLLFRSYRHDARLHKAYRRYQNLYQVQN